MNTVASFDRCPPLAAGLCMRDLGYHPAMCAFSATCCINTPVVVPVALVRESGWVSKREKAVAA